MGALARWWEQLDGRAWIGPADRELYARRAYRDATERNLRVAWLVLVVSLVLFVVVDYLTWRNGDWVQQPAHQRIFWWRLAMVAGLLALLALHAAVADEERRNRWFATASVPFYAAVGVGFVLACQTLITDVSIYVMFIIGVSVLTHLPTRLKLLVYPLGLAALAIGFELMGFNDVQSLHVLINASAATIGALFLDLVATRAYIADFLRSRELERSRARSDELLHNILPAQMVRRLKLDAGAVVEYHPEVSLLFADLVNFGELVHRLPPEQMIGLLDHLFLEFDEAADRFGVEKIKTIGDSYMAACGVPTAVPDHPRRTADLALRMQTIAQRLRADRQLPLHLRIGLHCGPAVAGVIGRRKFSYDLWGDTVALACNLQTFGDADRILISPAMHAALAGEFRCQPAREPLHIKNREPVQTWYLLGRRRDAEPLQFDSTPRRPDPSA